MDDPKEIDTLRSTPNGWLYLAETDELPVSAVMSTFQPLPTPQNILGMDILKHSLRNGLPYEAELTQSNL